jgi:hypothetical protein
LHLYCQIVGKVRLATTSPRNHWWNAPLYIDVRGLATRRMHHDNTTFEIDFDFIDHALLVRTHDGRNRSFPPADGVPVADFDARLHQMLSEHLRVEVVSYPEPASRASSEPGERLRLTRIRSWIAAPAIAGGTDR